MSGSEEPAALRADLWGGSGRGFLLHIGKGCEDLIGVSEVNTRFKVDVGVRHAIAYCVLRSRLVESVLR